MRPLNLLLITTMFGVIPELALAQVTNNAPLVPSIEIQFYSESIFEAVYKDVEVPRSVELTLVWGTAENLQVKHLDIKFGKRSSIIELDGPFPGPARLYLGKLTAEQLPGKSPIQEIPVLPGVRSLLIHMIPSGPGEYQFNVQNITDGLIPQGTARVVNLSDQTLAAVVADGKGIIEPGEPIDVSLSEIERFQLKMRYAAKSEDGWKYIYGTRMNAAPDDRLLIYVFRKWGTSGPWRVRLINL